MASSFVGHKLTANSPILAVAVCGGSVGRNCHNSLLAAFGIIKTNMIKGRLKIGDAMFVVRIEHYVTLRVFANALTENYYSKNEDFPDRLTKMEAEKILKNRLFFHGIRGELEHGFFEASFEEGEKFNSIYTKASSFVKQKYPWLTDNNRQ